MNKTVNILGTEYEISITDRKDDERLNTRDGYTDYSTKRIVVADVEKERDKDSIDDLKHYMNKVIRHECVHATLYESGLADNCDWAIDEIVVDWIAMQVPKMVKIWEKLEVL